MNSIAGIDHVGIVAPQLPPVEKALRRLGFHLTQAQPLVRPQGPGLPPKSYGQESQHAVFRDGYIELTAITDHTAGNHLEPFIKRYYGAHILALSVTDAERAWQDLKSRGVEAERPQPLTREVFYGRGGTAGFQWFPISHTLASEGYICTAHHLTPQVVYQPEVQSHPNGALRLSGAYLATDRYADAAERYARILDVPARRSGDRIEFHWPHQKLVLIDINQVGTVFPGVVPPHSPWVMGFAVDVADLNQTKQFLTAQGCRFESGVDGIWTRPEDGGGAIIVFRQAA